MRIVTAHIAMIGAKLDLITTRVRIIEYCDYYVSGSRRTRLVAARAGRSSQGKPWHIVGDKAAIRRRRNRDRSSSRLIAGPSARLSPCLRSGDVAKPQGRIGAQTLLCLFMHTLNLGPAGNGECSRLIAHRLDLHYSPVQTPAPLRVPGGAPITFGCVELTEFFNILCRLQGLDCVVACRLL